MAPIPFMLIQRHVVNKLQARLPQQLTYHSLSHTLDVLKQAETIALAEGLKCPEGLLSLKVAALYHDSGFIDHYHNHEAQGCRIAQQELPGFGFSDAQIEQICSMIRATKIPQNPTTHLEQIICDADLDYLGREDFSQIAQTLYEELVSFGVLAGEDEWNNLQVKFLESHQYFTCYSKANRELHKQAHLASLKNKLNSTKQTPA
ncbi:hypothetical protein GCM10023188_18560 [Pontibacter saemangeumensis]|uniref:HD/PDEase domain-containing protein n=1 Tax=Pontibacter saemangeumensis TaxID=1084525 RepID=A0ABP8LJZ5_9BACT